VAGVLFAVTCVPCSAPILPAGGPGAPLSRLFSCPGTTRASMADNTSLVRQSHIARPASVWPIKRRRPCTSSSPKAREPGMSNPRLPLCLSPSPSRPYLGARLRRRGRYPGARQGAASVRSPSPALLSDLAPSPRGKGELLSELIRAAAARRLADDAAGQVGAVLARTAVLKARVTALEGITGGLAAITTLQEQIEARIREIEDSGAMEARTRGQQASGWSTGKRRRKKGLRGQQAGQRRSGSWSACSGI
jgi:hypothetical protein